jgi:cellulase/cellobiase CelA1
MLKQLGLAAHWKVLVIAAAAVGVAAGLAIALPASRASTHRMAGSIPGQSDRAMQRVLGGAVHSTTGHPASGHPTAGPGGKRRAPRRAAPRAGCAVSYTPVNWPGSFLAKVTISNRGKTSIHGWTLTFKFSGNEAISSAWNATFTQTGAEVSARNLGFDATIRQGATQSLGFLGARKSDGAAPASFRVNGRVCQ